MPLGQDVGRERAPRTRSPVSSSGSVTWLRSQATTRKPRKPDQRPRRPRPRSEVAARSARRRMAPASPRAAIAVRSATRAVASLSSDSPSRIVTMRRGSPIRRPIAVAATASGGATTAPIANARGQPRSGSSACDDPATPAVVKTTSPTDSSRIGRRLALKSTREVCTAAAYSSGGSRPNSTTSASRSTSGTSAGRNPRHRRRPAAGAAAARSAPRPPSRPGPRWSARPGRTRSPPCHSAGPGKGSDPRRRGGHATRASAGQAGRGPAGRDPPRPRTARARARAPAAITHRPTSAHAQWRTGLGVATARRPRREADDADAGGGDRAGQNPHPEGTARVIATPRATEATTKPSSPRRTAALRRGSCPDHRRCRWRRP